MAIGLGELGWAPRVFWESTLSELLAAYRGYADRERRADFRLSHLTTWYANAHRNAESSPEPFVAADFFPSLPRPPEDEEEESDGDR